MELVRINNDVNGNPRYVTHYTNLLSDDEMYNRGLNIDEEYALAVSKARKIGGRKYHTKQFGGGIVFQSYNTDDLIKSINELKTIYVWH